ncbi:Mycobacterium numidiamassiliense ORFan [Mycobacterium numidiamassiliense]|uniref:Mycobacterium numidiamassiliense ORFan n=1 Tax=Mycobacterium numidiamassiliense TaxID=1841861 RepID=A0A2U3PG36_9MYCO|nr:Mycobacterium numidiamassiliense ORFan [Mycobacterium numidiamassiliense]
MAPRGTSAARARQRCFSRCELDVASRRLGGRRRLLWCGPVLIGWWRLRLFYSRCRRRDRCLRRHRWRWPDRLRGRDRWRWPDRLRGRDRRRDRIYRRRRGLWRVRCDLPQRERPDPCGGYRAVGVKFRSALLRSDPNRKVRCARQAQDGTYQGGDRRALSTYPSPAISRHAAFLICGSGERPCHSSGLQPVTIFIIADARRLHCCRWVSLD